MKRNKKFSFLDKIGATLAISVILSLNLAPLRTQAVDVQSLNDTVAGVSGFTHAARVTWDDINAADASVVQVQLFPIPTNSYIDRVAFYIEESFTNNTVASSNLVLSIGVGGTTNRFFGSNTIDGASIRIATGDTVWMLSTNLLVPYKSTTSTNWLTATFSDGAQASVVDNYVQGKVRILWRLVQPSRTKF
jgi:hypothetical protein